MLFVQNKHELRMKYDSIKASDHQAIYPFDLLRSLRSLQMKRRFTPIITTLTIALVLISSLAYAVEKKKHAKSVNRIPETITEEEALKAELLDATEEHQNKKSGLDDNFKKSNGDRSGVMKEQMKTKNNP